MSSNVDGTTLGDIPYAEEAVLLDGRWDCYNLWASYDGGKPPPGFTRHNMLSNICDEKFPENVCDCGGDCGTPNCDCESARVDTCCGGSPRDWYMIRTKFVAGAVIDEENKNNSLIRGQIAQVQQTCCLHSV